MQNQLFNIKNALYFEEIDSTNRIARELAQQGAPEGTVVHASRQTAGRGRLGRAFHSPQGGLYLSVILRPTVRADELLALTACIAVAVHRALRDLGIKASIKWVNDLFLGGRKICGILCEGQFSGEMPDFIIAGIGLNLRPDPALPEALRPIVTDLATETGQCIAAEDCAQHILTHMQSLLRNLADRSFMAEYREFSATLGHDVQIRQGDRSCIAHAIGYTDDAALIVRHPDGTEEILQSGTATSL